MTPLLLTALICASAAHDASSGDAASAQETNEAAPKRFFLENGLEVILAPDPAQVAAAVNIWYHAGADQEPEGRRGLAHLVEHLMFEGSANVGPGEHVRRLREIGVDSLNAHTGRHRTRYLTTVAPEGLETVLWLEAERMGTILQGLTRAAFERERAVVIRELRERVDLAPYGLAAKRLWQELFPRDHPYHYRIEGLEQDLRAVTYQDVRRFFQTWYGPTNATLVVTGRFDEGYVRRLVDRYFGRLPAGGRRVEGEGVSTGSTGGNEPHTKAQGASTGENEPSPEAQRISTGTPEPPPPPASTRSVVHHDEAIARAPAVIVGWHAPAAGHDESVLALVTAEVLGAGGSGGLLQRRLVGELGLARRVGVHLSEQAGGSVLRVRAIPRAGVEPARLLEAIDETLAGLARGELQEIDAERARRRLETRRASALDGASGLVEAAERIHRASRGLLLDECVPVETLGTEAIARFAREWLNPKSGAVVLASPPGRAAATGDRDEARAEAP